MNNYEKMMEAARRRFLGYDMAALAARTGVEDRGGYLYTFFFGKEVRVEKTAGTITVDGHPGDFGETLSVFDWLCDGKPDAVAAGEFCPVSSLPGVYVSGSGLSMNSDRLAARIHESPEKFRSACEKMGGKAIPMGDMGYSIDIFPRLPMCLKFYFADEEFPAALNLLWDKNILRFVRYETVYYIAGCLREYLLRLM